MHKFADDCFHPFYELCVQGTDHMAAIFLEIQCMYAHRYPCEHKTNGFLMLSQRRDGESTFKQRWVNVSCLLG